MTGTPTPDPSDSREHVAAALKPWGWTCSDDFWHSYHQDVWIFNLVNALTRTTAEVERLRSRPCPYVETSDGGTSHCTLAAATWDDATTGDQP